MVTASAFFKLIPSCEGMNSGDVWEWISEDEEQMADNLVVDIASHYW
jgi:hypothetical protein